MNLEKKDKGILLARMDADADAGSLLGESVALDFYGVLPPIDCEVFDPVLMQPLRKK